MFPPGEVPPNGFPDLCHANPYVENGLLEWGNWLKNNITFDAWRFDYVKGFHPWMVENWMNNVSGWGVVEFWDGDKDKIFTYLDSTGNSVSAFDFPLYYTLRDMCNSNGAYDLQNLANTQYLGIVGSRPYQSVPFVANHDTDEITQNKLLAYAFILTAEGYPCVFWSDWVNPDLQEELNTLITIHNTFASGSTTVLHSDPDLYVAQRNGDPGCIVMINDKSGTTDWSGVTVQTKWVNTTLVDYTGQAFNETTDEYGYVEIWAPPQGYTIFAPEITEETTTTTTTTVETTSETMTTTETPSTSSETFTTSTESTTETSQEKTTSTTSSLLMISFIMGMVFIVKIRRKR
jgi:alpha-amylase